MIENEIKSIVRDLERLPSSDLYESNKLIVKKVCDGFLLKRENLNQKDFYIQLFDYSDKGNNTHKIVSQSAIKSGYVTKPLWS
jgi:type I restriction enzyme R subunit